MLADPSVQIVYVASPHSEHFKQASMAIEAGKHVLIEKAFTRNAGEAWQLAHAAQAAGVTLMEAMWTRFLPHTDVVRQLLADGTLGELETLIADHGQALGPDKAPRLHDPALAGGALLDLGIYPISYAVFALGLPGRVQAVGTLTPTGVDSQVSILMDGFARHPRAQALLSTTLAARPRPQPRSAAPRPGSNSRTPSTCQDRCAWSTPTVIRWCARSATTWPTRGCAMKPRTSPNWWPTAPTGIAAAAGGPERGHHRDPGRDQGTAGRPVPRGVSATKRLIAA